MALDLRDARARIESLERENGELLESRDKLAEDTLHEMSKLNALRKAVEKFFNSKWTYEKPTD